LRKSENLLNSLTSLISRFLIFHFFVFEINIFLSHYISLYECVAIKFPWIINESTLLNQMRVYFNSFGFFSEMV